MSDSIPNPLRLLGLARIAAGAWFVVTGVTTLSHFAELVPQAKRLLEADSGTTGAPIRAVVTMVTAIVLVVLGVMLIAKGIAWLRRVPVPKEGPAAIAPSEVASALRDRQLSAYADGPKAPSWAVRHWLAEQAADMTWWRREILSDGVSAFVRSLGLLIVVVGLCLALPRILSDDLLGPFPMTFVIVLPFATALWAAHGIMLMESGGPRIESVEFSLPAGAEQLGRSREQQIIETRPVRANRESPVLGLTLGATGVIVQCLMLTWWDLSPIDYPLRVTSFIRMAGAIGGGVLFYLIGDRMVAAAAKLLLLVRYESMLIMVEANAAPAVARAAEIRTESFGLTGPRHIVSAAGGVVVREAAESVCLLSPVSRSSTP